MTPLTFEVLVDDVLANVTSTQALKAVAGKRILSLINDFEDGAWRTGRFNSFLWDNIAETALSARERAALVDKGHSSLVAAAKNLRLTDRDVKGQGSEIAEIFLYGIMRSKFGALPVVPKIFYKQNSQDNAKGADSVHIVVHEGDFTLWFGEAKFYNSIENARLDSVVKSVLNSLRTDKIKKENSIITNVSDIETLDIPLVLCENIKKALDPKETIDCLKSKIHVPILLLHECPITASTSCLSDEYRKDIIDFHTERASAYFSKQIAKSDSVFNYTDLHFEIILFPVPDKRIIVEGFLAATTFYKAQA